MMRTSCFSFGLGVALAGTVGAQAQAPAQDAKFFLTDSVITVTLTTNLRQLRGDHPAKTDKSEKSPWRAASLRFADGGAQRVLPVRVRTRGIWRLKNCEFPPLRLNFTKDSTKHTVFRGLDKPKLVTYCRDNDSYEDYLLKEFQLYRVYHVLTPASHAVRLLKLSYADSASGKVVASRYAFIEEEPDALAARIGGKLSKLKGALPDDLEPVHDAVVGLFQYLIGNTDFGIGGLHNAELIAMDNGDNWPVVYDFDFSGAVNARYATVDPSIHVPSVRDRVYRGYCVPPETYPPVVALFNERKDAIYNLYRDSLGKRLKPDDVKETLKYFDEFYRTINSPNDFKTNVVDACLGTKKK
jgi:hypothetical protein